MRILLISGLSLIIIEIMVKKLIYVHHYREIVDVILILTGQNYSPSPNSNFPKYSIVDCWPSEILQGHGIFINNMYILFRRTINVT